MDLTPIYELRSRLRAAAIAGTELVAEDYRLKRALEAMKPLEKASPVFAKIGMLVRKLLAPDCPDRVGFLMEAISLTDAVLCTQGAMAVSGELKEIETVSGVWNSSNIPYSILHTLLDALQNSGQGRYSYVLEMHKNQPELFEDYRVKQAMVQALGASYGELADQVAEWLKQDGKTIVPLLKDGFDKNGKKEMVRRVQIIEAICKDGENDFYLEQIPDSEKSVRNALIFALRHNQENVDALIDLTRTEKGNCKKMAYWALACMEGEVSETFWREYVKKKPLDAIPYLALSKADWACELVADKIENLLHPWLEDGAGNETEQNVAWTDEILQQLEVYQHVLLGKSGEIICDCFRKIAKVESLFHLQRETVSCGKTLHMAYLRNPAPDLAKLALELYETYGNSYFAAALSGKLVECSEKECCAWVEEQMWKKSLLTKKIREERIVYLLDALEEVLWDKEMQAHVLETSGRSLADEQRWECKTIIRQPMETYFTDLLMKLGKFEADEIMSRWVVSWDSEQSVKLRDYYYKKASVSKDNRRYLPLLKRCGAQECKGLAVQYFSRKGSVSLWEIGYYFLDLPGSVEAKREEAKNLCDVILRGGIRGVRIKEENVETLIDAWVRQTY